MAAPSPRGPNVSEIRLRKSQPLYDYIPSVKTVVCSIRRMAAPGTPAVQTGKSSEIRLRKSQPLYDYIPSVLLPPCPPSIYPSTKAGQQPRDISGEVGRDERG